MDADTKLMEEYKSNESITSSIDEESCNVTDVVDRRESSLFEETGLMNPSISTNIYGSNEDTKTMESTVDELIIAKNTSDEIFPSTKAFPDVPVDNESTKEKQSEIASLNKRQEIDKDFPSTRVFPGVLFDSESTKENQTNNSVVTETTASSNDVKKDMFVIQDALLFCPMGGTIVHTK